jgi:hypothetical protein
MWLPAVLDPALPARSKMASGSPERAGAVVGEHRQWVGPEGLLLGRRRLLLL